MPRQPVLRLPSRRASAIRGLALGLLLPVAATLLLPLAPLPPLWPSLGPLAGPALALSLVTLAGALAAAAVHALIGRALMACAFRIALATALLSPFGGSLLIPACLAVLRYRERRPPRAANDNAPRCDTGWVPVTPERARLVSDQSVA